MLAAPNFPYHKVKKLHVHPTVFPKIIGSNLQ